MNDTPELKQMVWHSRRGMLELDLLLVPFAENHLFQLEPRMQSLYRKLLDEEDQDLFTWLIEKSKPEDPEIQEIISLILVSRK